jgi:hypothetical protein
MDQQVFFDINAPPANAEQQQAAHAEAQAQADAVNAAQNLAAQADGAHSGSTSPAIGSVNNDTNHLVALLIQGQQQLIQGQQQLQQMVGAQQADHVIFQQAFAGVPTPLRSDARVNIASTLYDINNPGLVGTTPANKVKHNPALDFAKPTAQFSDTDWLMAIEQSCTFNRVDYPTAYASSCLTKEAGTIFNAAFKGRDTYTITWGEFRAWLLASSLHDRLADQKLLDDVFGLQQGNMSIKEFTSVGVTLLQFRRSPRISHPEPSLRMRSRVSMIEPLLTSSLPRSPHPPAPPAHCQLQEPASSEKPPGCTSW